MLDPGPEGATTSLAWRWNGTEWSQAAGPSPSSRFSAALAFDAERNQVVLFGGADVTGFLDDTWLWTSGSWQRH